MENKRGEFLRLAVSADRKAEQAIDPRIANGWREIAASWRHLAEHWPKAIDAP